MADIIYNSAKEYMIDGTINLKTNTFKVVLLAETYTPSAAHSAYTDISANELSTAGGYTAGGQALTGVTWTRSTGTCTWDANDSSWTSATFTARYAAIYSDTSTGDKLVMMFDFGANKSVTSGTFTLQYNAAGLLTLS